VDGLAVQLATTDWIGDAAFKYGITVYELTKRTASLEDAFLELTSGDQQFELGSSAPGETS